MSLKIRQQRRRIVLGTAVGALLMLVLFSTVIAAPGDLDPTFDGDGKVTTSLTGFDLNSVLRNYLGDRLVAAGFAGGDAVVIRYNADGSLDTSFSEDGKAFASSGDAADFANAMIVTADGKIITAGYNEGDLMLARFNADGSLDTSFDEDGIVTTSLTGNSDFAYDIILDSSNKIVVSGEGDEDAALVRYNYDGSLDNTFGEATGKVITDISGTNDGLTRVFEIGGKYLCAGFFGGDFGLAKYNADGTFDTSFGGGDGIVTTDLGTINDQPWGGAIDGNNKLVLSGRRGSSTTGDSAIVRYNLDGTLDASFGGGDGIVIVTASADFEDNLLRVAIQQPGNYIVAAGSVFEDESISHFLVMRFNEDGSVDPSFGGDGVVNTTFSEQGDDASDIVIDSQNRIVVSGTAHLPSFSFEFALARYDGSLPGQATATPTSTDIPSTETSTPTPTGTSDTPTSTPTPTETTPAGIELVQNGGFELKDGDNKPDITPWTLKNATKDKAKCDKPEKPVAHNGTCAFVFKGQTGENSQLVQIIEPTDNAPTAGDTLDLSAFIKATNAATAGKIKLRVSYTDNTDKGKLNLDLATAADYTELTGNLPLLADVAKIKLQIKHSSTAGKVYLDDVSLTRVDAAGVARQVIPLP